MHHILVFLKCNVILLTLTLIAISGCKKDEDIPVPTAREKAVSDYYDHYIGSNVSDPGWTGDRINCIAGSVSQSTLDKVIQRINYFRRLVGLNDNTTLDLSKSAMYQEAALMMDANSSLSHSPPNTWKCWTQIGANGAASSNLSLGAHSSNAIRLFIEEPGQNNKEVGHRRWILHSTKTKFSFGTTNYAASLAAFGIGEGNTLIPEFIAYPAKGFMPQTLVFPRWSFSIPNADFSSATVFMNGPDGNVPLNIISATGPNYGDNTIVWEPQGVKINSDADLSYRVTIEGVKNTSRSSYNYTVTIFKP